MKFNELMEGVNQELYLAMAGTYDGFAWVTMEGGELQGDVEITKHARKSGGWVTTFNLRVDPEVVRHHEKVAMATIRDIGKEWESTKYVKVATSTTAKMVDSAVAEVTLTAKASTM